MVERFEIERGLNIPIDGEPAQHIDAKEVNRVALLADDYVGMRPTMLVGEGDSVQLGQPVFADKKTDGVIFTAPASGRVTSIIRGEKRRFYSLVIEKEGNQESKSFASYSASQLNSLDRVTVVQQLADSGLWTALRTRPYSKVPSPSSAAPVAVFVNAMDTNPLAADPSPIITAAAEEFKAGLEIVAKLSPKTYLCRAPGASTPGEMISGVQIAEFEGPHPAGLPGTHMHFLRPAAPGKVNWYLNYQDVIAIGRLFLTGKVDPTRIISLAGPAIKTPRLIQTQLGASLTQLIDGELKDGSNRLISGSVLCGRKVAEPVDFLGRFHLQVTALKEGFEREFLGWQMPGFNKFSVTRAFASAFGGPKKFAFSTSTGGSERAMVPIGSYEKVLPLDLIATPLLRSLISRDTVTAQQLGCLELDEEDLALCTFVCPGKYEYGEILRDNLLKIEKEG